MLSALSYPHNCYFQVDSIGQIFSIMCSSQALHLKARLRADIKVKLLTDATEPTTNRSSFYVVMSLLGRHLLYYNFLREGAVYLLKSTKPIETYLNLSEVSPPTGVGKSVVSILQVDDSIRIYDEFKPPEHIETS